MMMESKKAIRRSVAVNRNGFATVATATFLLFPLLLLVSTSHDPTRRKVVEAFVIPGGRNCMKRSSNARQNGEFASPLHLVSRPTRKNSMIDLPRASFHLHSTQQQQQPQEQQQQEDPNEEDENQNENESKSGAVKRLLLDAERLRLEAEQMDATLTLQKIAALEDKLSNDDWLKKQKGSTVKDLYEQLRRLERKISNPDSTVLNNDRYIKNREMSSSTTASSSSSSSSSVNSSSSNRYNNNSERKNPNLPPIAGFDDKDLNLYVPVAEDVTRLAPNATLNERIGLFRDAPELQAHFKEKIQSLLLGPLEEMQELQTLKLEYFDSTSSKEKGVLLKQIKRLEAKIQENDVGSTTNGGSGGNDPGGIGYSNSILISPEKLPPLTENELQERYETIKALPDILVAVYLQRNGLYSLPESLSTIDIDVEVKSGKIGANVNIVNTSAINANDNGGEENDDEAKQIETDSNGELDEKQSNAENEIMFDLYENLKLAIRLDYYDLQLQLLNQALGIRPMPEEVRKDYAAAFRSLPAQVRERYVTDNLGIDTLEATVIASDEESDVERVLEEILKPLDEQFLPFSQAAGSFMNLNGKNEKGNGQGGQEQTIELPEYNDVEFIDRSRFLEEFMPSIALLEDQRPSPEDVDLFVTDCLTRRGNKPFMVTSKPERVIGGYYVRGTNQLGFDEKDSTTANDRLTQEVYQLLQNHPTLKDKIEFYYILDPSPPSDEDMELEVNLNPLFLITGKDPQTMYNLSAPLTKAAVTISGLLSAFLFSIGSCVLNPKINASIQNALDSVSSQTSSTVFIDVQWFYDMCLPLYFSFLGILLAHELGHRAVASYYKFDIGLPNVLPSLTMGLSGSITPIKSPPPNNKALFDFAIAGPLAGLTVSIGLLFVGLELTRQMGIDANLPVLPVDLARSSSLGGGMIQYFLGKYTLLPGEGPGAYVGLHPFAISGWIGCTINALALLPLGHTDGGRVALAMFGRRGAFVTKLFTVLILVASGLLGLDEMNILLAYAVLVLVWQRELESPIRNEVDELDFSRGLLGISSAILVGLILIPMTS